MADVSEAPVLPTLEGTALHVVYPWRTSLWQVMRFGIVGILNTTIDLVTLNILLWQFPTHSVNALLVYNSIAYILGALNSFGLNKYWTFKRKYAIKGSELVRFAIVNIVGILCNDGLIWIVATLLRPLVASNLPWANISKLIATAGTMIISYLGMRLWVFAVKSPSLRVKRRTRCMTLLGNRQTKREPAPSNARRPPSFVGTQFIASKGKGAATPTHSPLGRPIFPVMPRPRYNDALKDAARTLPDVGAQFIAPTNARPSSIHTRFLTFPTESFIAAIADLSARFRKSLSRRAVDGTNK